MQHGKARKSSHPCHFRNPSSSTNQRVLRSLFPRPDVATVSHFAVFVVVDVQLQDGQDAARESEEKQSSVPFPVLITEAQRT